ncbi:helix-turn-helix domain-containing protein [Streptomyces sp. NPDC056549]|uniref:helix-turn-helix domain-containing protein n=1 Tax=Streptomyces sp. NPDC056549 TaxID=3345864 RepID=UPI0036C40C93
MKRKVGYTWRLRELMAQRHIFDLSASQVHRMVSGTPERLSLQVLSALCDILSCTPADLVTTTAENAGVRKTATGDLPTPPSNVAKLRPRAARILPDATRGTCPGCGQDRALPGRHPADGSAICTTCAGFSQTFDCSRCGFEGKLLGGRLCERCTLTDRLTALLDDGTGRVRPTLTPLLDMLVAMDEPRSGLSWLTMRRGQPGNASQLLRRLGLGQVPLTHDAFHELQPWRAAAHLEELLMASGVLPAVDKYICSFQRWLPGHLAGIADPEHLKTIKLFATWRILPHLRERADRSRITPSVRGFAAEQITCATAFLHWLSARNSTLASLGQLDIDAWFAENTERGRTSLRPFLNWAMQSCRCPHSLFIPAQRISRRPALSEDERLAALGRLLTDTDVPMRLRVAGVIVLLYAQPLTRIVRLTIDDVLHDGETTLLRLGEPASPIPSPVAALLLAYIADRGNMNTATNQASRWLFPGRRAGQPARPDHLSALLGEIGIPVAAARGAAARQQLLELPAPVVADALGYHDKTTSRLLRESGGTWSRYAAGDHTRSPAGWAPWGTHGS